MRCARQTRVARHLALGLLLASGAVHAAAPDLEQEIQAGRGIVNAFVEQFGVSEDAQLRGLAERVLERLAQAAGERPELKWRIVVLKYNPASPVARNASAWPGGYIVTDDAFLKTVEAAGAGDAERAERLLAGVLAHEMAHVMRRDTDSIVPVYLKQQGAAPAQLLFSLKSSPDAPKTDAAEQRRRENESDRQGAFFLLRAGYRVEDMIGVFRVLAAEEVDEVLFNSEVDHARSAERVGNILEVKSQVIEDERLYDEAVNILAIGLNDMLSVAEANLDAVARHFPTLLPVRHARAVLLHRKYLATVTPRELFYKPSFSFYRLNLAGTRAVREEALLRQALALYEGILKEHEAHGYKGLGPTAAAYALGLAQLGEREKALTWAQKAVELMPDDWNGYNVLGLALQKAGRATEAIPHLEKAVALGASPAPKAMVERALKTTAMEERAVWRDVEGQAPVDFGPALFNLGLAHKSAGHKDAAAHAFLAYLATDWRSDWADLARAHLEWAGRPTTTPVPPVAGVMVGLSDVELRKRLGTPEQVANPVPGTQVWRYKSKGFTFFLDGSSRVRAALLYAPYAGQFGAGVKIGVPAAAVEKTWGKPTARAQAGEREAWSYGAQGLSFLMARGKVEKVLWAPAPLPGGAGVQAAALVNPNDGPDQVRAVLGSPESGEGEETQGGLWRYDSRGIRIRFGPGGRVALVTISRPNSAAVAGVKLGDPPTKIRQLVGTGFVTTDVGNVETHSFPDRGLAFVVRNAEVSVITLFAPQKQT